MISDQEIRLAGGESPSGGLRTRGWTLVSYRGSANAQVLSVLGVIETLAATGVYWWVAIHWGTAHLAISGCVAFLLFLRTEDSVARGLDWSRRIVESRRPSDPGHPPPTLRDWAIMAAIVGLVALMVRIGATVVSTLRHPLMAFRAVPQNWSRVSLCTDVCTMPEPIAGIDDPSFDGPGWHELVSIRFWLGELRRAEGWLVRGLIALRLVPLVLFVAVPAWLYRVALKGTSIFYWVLMFKVSGSFSDDPELRVRMICEQSLQKISRAYSLFFLVYFGSRILFAPFWLECARWLSGAQESEVVAAYLVGLPLGPEAVSVAIPRWQFAAALAALLVWVVYFVADRGRVMRRAAPSVHNVISGLLLVKSFLTFYTLWVSIYVAMSLVNEWELPPIGDDWLPFDGFKELWEVVTKRVPFLH